MLSTNAQLVFVSQPFSVSVIAYHVKTKKCITARSLLLFLSVWELWNRLLAMWSCELPPREMWLNNEDSVNTYNIVYFIKVTVINRLQLRKLSGSSRSEEVTGLKPWRICQSILWARYWTPNGSWWAVGTLHGSLCHQCMKMCVNWWMWKV